MELDGEESKDLAMLEDISSGKLLEHLPSLQELVEFSEAGVLPKKCFDKMSERGVIEDATARILNKKQEQQYITDYFVKGEKEILLVTIWFSLY